MRWRGGVDLSVATAVEAEALAAGPDWDRRGAVPAGERGVRLEPVDPRGLRDDVGCGQDAAVGEGQKGRRQPADDAGDVTFELVDSNGQITDPSDELGSDLGGEAVECSEPLLGVIEHRPSLEGLRRDEVLGHQLVEVPAKPRLHASPLTHQVVSVIDEELVNRPGFVGGS